MRIARIAALLLVASCSNVLDPGPNSPTGTYTLVRLDGASLPAPITSGVIVRGSIELKSSSHYTVIQTDSAAGTANNTSTTGTWSVTDNALQLVPDGGGLLLGVVFRDSILMEYRGHQNVYARH